MHFLIEEVGWNSVYHQIPQDRMKLSLPPNTPRQDETQFTTKYPKTGWNPGYHQIPQDRMKLSLPPNTPRQDETQFTTKYPKTGWNSGYQILGIWATDKNFSHPTWIAYNFSSPNHKHQNWYCRRWGRLPPNNNRRLEQICVPPFLSLLDGLVHLINKT